MNVTINGKPVTDFRKNIQKEWFQNFP